MLGAFVITLALCIALQSAHGPCLPARTFGCGRRNRRWWRRSTPEMRYTYFVAFAESCPISLAELTPELRVAVLVAIVYVRPAVILEISPRSLQSVVESA